VPWMELRSHQQVLEQLRRALSRGRMGHSFLFVGSEGVGKKRVAQHVAQGLLCEQNPPPLLSPCGHCGG
jgi:DNA polymerase-3 subunit delta'